MYCQECGKEAQAGELICSSCGGALTDAELDLPEVAAFAIPASPAVGATQQPAQPQWPTPAPMPTAPSPASGAPPAATSGPRLEITVGGLSGSQPLQREVITIGRADPASGHRPDVDLSMDAAVSRRHAEIRHSPAGYRIIDLGSTNGTVLNGQQMPRQQELPLADGDEIHLGENCKLTLRL